MSQRKTFYYGDRLCLTHLLAHVPSWALKLFTAPDVLTDAMGAGDFTYATFNGSTPRALTGGIVLPGNPNGLATIAWNTETFTKGAGGPSETVKGFAICDDTGAPYLGQTLAVPKAFGTTGDYLTIKPRYYQGPGTPSRFSLSRYTGNISALGHPAGDFTFGDGGGGGGGGGGFSEAFKWAFSEGSGSTIAESVAGNTGTLYGSGPPSWTSDHPTSGHSVQFNANGGIHLASSLVDWSADFSLFCRAKVYVLSATCLLINSPGTSSGISFYLDVGGSSSLTLHGWGGSVDISRTLPSSPYDAWHSFGVTVIGSTMQLYYDGAPLGSTGGMGGASFSNNTSAHYLGSADYYTGSKMYFTDCRVWSSGLDATAMAAVHADI